MIPDQEKRIENYLLSIGLAYNIMLEIKDHMISQVNEIMNTGEDFETAFREAKKEWEPELKTVNMFLFSSGRMPKIQKRMLTKESNLLWTKAFGFSLSVIFLFFAFSKIFSKEIFIITYSIYYYVLGISIAVYIIVNYQIFLVKRRYNYLKITGTQYLMTTIFTGLLYVLLEIISLDYRPTKVYDYFNLVGQLKLSPLLWILLSNSYIAYGIMAFTKYKKDVKAVQHHLNTTTSC